MCPKMCTSDPSSRICLSSGSEPITCPGGLQSSADGRGSVGRMLRSKQEGNRKFDRDAPRRFLFRQVERALSEHSPRYGGETNHNSKHRPIVWSVPDPWFHRGNYDRGMDTLLACVALIQLISVSHSMKAIVMHTSSNGRTLSIPWQRPTPQHLPSPVRSRNKQC